MGKLWLHNSHAKLLAAHVKEQHVLCLVVVHPKLISLHSYYWATSSLWSRMLGGKVVPMSSQAQAL